MDKLFKSLDTKNWLLSILLKYYQQQKAKSKKQKKDIFYNIKGTRGKARVQSFIHTGKQQQSKGKDKKLKHVSKKVSK